MRNRGKLYVVPNLSVRKMTWLGIRRERGAPLSAVIAGSFHVVKVPLEIFAVAGPSIFNEVTPLM